MERLPKLKRTLDYLGKSFEVEDVSVLDPQDIQRGDRVIINTASGNRYMVRRSESRNGALMISNERKSGFNTSHLLLNQGEAIAEVGKVMAGKIIIDEVKRLGSEISTTEVTAIEIRRGLDKAIHEAAGKINGSGLAQVIKDQIGGRKDGI